MEVYQTENQQIEAIKQFLSKYKRIILGVFFGFALVLVATQYWRYYTKGQVLQASDLYQEMLNAENKDDQQQMDAKGQQLMQAYSSTPYPQLAALLLAKHAIIAGDNAQAEEKLRWVLAHKSSKSVALHIATTRLARILLEKRDFDAALKLLDTKKLDSAYIALYEETRGDIYLAQGNNDQAKAAYTKALNSLAPGEEAPILQLKLMSLGGQPAVEQSIIGEDNA